MARVSAGDIKDFLADVQLQRAWYRLEVIDSKVREPRDSAKSPRWLITTVVQDGPTQASGKSPVGTQVQWASALGGFEGDKDGGRFRSRNLGNALGVLIGEDNIDDDGSFEEASAVGVVFDGLIGPGKDMDDLPIDEIKKFRKVGAAE